MLVSTLCSGAWHSLPSTKQDTFTSQMFLKLDQAQSVKGATGFSDIHEHGDRDQHKRGPEVKIGTAISVLDTFGQPCSGSQPEKGGGP